MEKSRKISEIEASGETSQAASVAIKVAPDNEEKSIESEGWNRKCDSNNWVLADEITASQLSTMKDTFRFPLKEENHLLGRRTQMLVEQMRKEAATEARMEVETQPDGVEYLTTYDETYCCRTIPNFEPKQPPRLVELYNQYPLYGNAASTFWHYQQAKSEGPGRAIIGSTKVTDMNNPFRKNATFSKPLTDCTDGTCPGDF